MDQWEGIMPDVVLQPVIIHEKRYRLFLTEKTDSSGRSLTAPCDEETDEESQRPMTSILKIWERTISSTWQRSCHSIVAEGLMTWIHWRQNWISTTQQEQIKPIKWTWCRLGHAGQSPKARTGHPEIQVSWVTMDSSWTFGTNALSRENIFLKIWVHNPTPSQMEPQSRSGFE